MGTYYYTKANLTPYTQQIKIVKVKRCMVYHVSTNIAIKQEKQALGSTVLGHLGDNVMAKLMRVN